MRVWECLFFRVAMPFHNRLGGAQEMVRLFSDNEHGGFFLTGKDSEKLIARTKPGIDGAVPSGNSIAAFALLKLGNLTMKQSFTEQGTRTLEAFSRQLEQSPAYSSGMLVALNFWLGPKQEIVIAGSAKSTDTKQMITLVRSKFLPNVVVLLHDRNAAGPAIERIVPFVKNQTTIDGKATAYVCENYVCNRPVNNINELETMLSSISR
jgi:uncharacterized protein YyaL (SSP411 family)